MDMPSIKAALRREQAERAANRIKQLSPQKQKSTPTLSSRGPDHGFSPPPPRRHGSRFVWGHCCAVVFAALACLVGALVALVPPPELPRHELRALAAAAMGVDQRTGSADAAAAASRWPLAGKVALVTGATSGIGLQTAKELFALGATVHVVSRTEAAGARARAEILAFRAPHTGGDGGDAHGDLRGPGGVVACVPTDLSDLNAVETLAESFLNVSDETAMPKRLDLLILNAGIHYASMDPARFLPSLPLLPGSSDSWPGYASAQGYDLSFAANYLGHFLLTQKLAPLLVATAAREDGAPAGGGQGFASIVHVSSSWHYHGDGSGLVPASNGTTTTPNGGSASSVMPPAARSEVGMPPPSRAFRHRHLAYGDSKLAQVLHAHELARRLAGSGVRVAAVCPGWVATAILPDSPMGNLARAAAYPLSAGVYAPLCAALGGGRGGDHDGAKAAYVSNHVNALSFVLGQGGMEALFDLSRFLPGLREYGLHALGGLVMVVQRFTYGCHPAVPSKESRDVALQRQLWDWSEAAVDKANRQQQQH